MTNKQTQPSYLTSAQVLSLNEKHGCFQYGDAQSDVSRAFAQDAIAMHERIRAAAPDLLEALEHCIDWLNAAGIDEDLPVQRQAAAAIAKATGKKVGRA